jgi:hypothetical protein
MVPELSFQVEGVESLAHAVAPMLAFKLRVSNTHREEQIHSILLRCQIQIEATRRRYTSSEESKLFDLFGQPQAWSQTLRSMLWAQASASVPGFAGSTLVDLPIPCTYDLNLAATKYFDALETGEIPLRFLFSGTVFYGTERNALQVAQIPWDKEATFRLPLEAWREMMDRHYPNTAWLCLRKDLFDRLQQYKSEVGAATWEQALENLLASASAAASHEGPR